MITIRLLAAILLAISASAFADTSNVQDFRVVYHLEPGQPASQEALRGVQRASELQPRTTGETLTHRRTLPDGSHEMRASRAMTRAQAWALAEKLQRDNSSIARVQPIDPETAVVHGRKPTGAGARP